MAPTNTTHLNDFSTADLTVSLLLAFLGPALFGPTVGFTLNAFDAPPILIGTAAFAVGGLASMVLLATYGRLH
jgi:hypothetical protein